MCQTFRRRSESLCVNDGDSPALHTDAHTEPKSIIDGKKNVHSSLESATLTGKFRDCAVRKIFRFVIRLFVAAITSEKSGVRSAESNSRSILFATGGKSRLNLGLTAVISAPHFLRVKARLAATFPPPTIKTFRPDKSIIIGKNGGRIKSFICKNSLLI